MKSIRTFTLLFIMTCLSIGFSGCDGTMINPLKITGNIAIEPLDDSDEDLKATIGVVVSLTGRHAEPYGYPMFRGFELARKHINAENLLADGVSIEFITADDRSTVAGAESAVQNLVDQGVPAIVVQSQRS